MERSTQVSDEGNNSSQDRISALPDEILLHILSLLPPGEAVKTGALSKRWEYLWTSVPNLSFSCHCLEPESVSFVNQSLLFHKRRNVTKFRVTTPYDETIASDVDNWVRFVTRANVEELCLDLDGGDVDYDFYYELPHLLYTNSSIRKLTLICCNVEPNGLIKWKSLKSLLIGFVKLSEDVIQKILVGSPVLEFLDLCGFDGFYRLDIGSASLRKLVVRDHWPVEDEVDGSNLEISAPNLQSLSILGEMFHMKVRLVNVQSLDDCNLNFQLDTDDEDKNNDYEVHRNMLRELLVSLGNVKQLTLGNWCIQVLSMLELKDTLFPLAKCKCLILDTPIKKCDVPGIAGLLHSSPSLETLIIKISMISLYNSSSIFHSENDFDGKFPENYLTSEKGRSKCLPLQLKTVKIVGFMESELVIPLVQFLLEMAKVLEKIYIDVEGDLSDKWLELAQKLQNLPRISPHAEVLFLNVRENS